MPTRFAVDLLRAARSTATTVAARVVRDGRRVRSATLLKYRRSSVPTFVSTDVRRHHPACCGPHRSDPSPPPDDQMVPFIGSDAGWTRTPAAHRNDSRKNFYYGGINVVAGEKVSPFVRPQSSLTQPAS